MTAADAARQLLTDAEVAPLVGICGELKGELVQFALSKQFARERANYLEEQADRLGHLSDLARVAALDAFMLQHKLPGGATVVERFTTRRRPPFTTEQKEIL